MQIAKSEAIKRFRMDIEAVLGDMNGFGHYPEDDADLFDIKVSDVEGGHALLSVVLPEPMLRGFVALLEGFHHQWSNVLRQTKIVTAQKKAVDPVEMEKRRRLRADREKLILDTFDNLIKAGIPEKDAIKKTRADLKAKGLQWCDHFIVVQVLRDAGCFRRGNGRITR